MAETTLFLEKAEPLLVFGIHDSHLKRIESAFADTKFSVRGNMIKLRGPKHSLSQIKKTFNELSSIATRSGSVTDTDVYSVLSLTTSTQNPESGQIGEAVVYTPSGGMIRTKTLGQSRFVQAAHHSDIVFAIGPAGTGKTFLAVALAVSALRRRKVKRIVLSRPAVEAGERLGFLPGDFRDKIDPYLRPLYDALEALMPPEKLSTSIENRTIEIVPLAFMRGRTLDGAFVILDEAQNATTTQMKMFLTRLGVASRAIVTGDITQIDLNSKSLSGLIEAQKVLGGIHGVDFVHFSKQDVVRHRLVKEIIAAYERKGGENRKD